MTLPLLLLFALPRVVQPVVANRELAPVVEQWNRQYSARHPQARFAILPANNLAALQCLAFDTTAFAPVTCDTLGGAAVAYGALVHDEAWSIRVGRASAVVAIVPAASPVNSLSTEQIARIFTVTMRKPTLSQWGQAGASGTTAAREIHQCGLPWSDHFASEDPEFGEWMFGRQLGGGPPVPAYCCFPTYAEVVSRVERDPGAIGLVPEERVPAGAKIVARFDRYLELFVRLRPGRPLEPWLGDYLRGVLSSAGQQAVARGRPGWQPLSELERAEELDKVRRAESRRYADPADVERPKAPDPDPIYIAGNDLMAPILAGLNERFLKTHPQVRFRMDLFGSGLGLSGVTSGKSAFGPMARDATEQDRDAFRSRFGYPPTDIRIGWDNTPDADHFPPGKYPPAVWVNARNPVPSLTLRQIAGIFTTGAPGGDITRWGQISGDEGPVGANGGDWAKREIHIYLPVLRGLPILATTRLRLGGNPWSRRVEYLPLTEDVMNAVANDPFGVGLIGWFPTDEGWDRQAELGTKVRLMPLAADDDSPVSHGGVGDLYPLAGGLHLFINRPPGRPIEPWLKDYLELALSPEGQALIASLTKTDGFIPLSAADAASERQKLGN